MPRRAAAARREVQPDAVYNNRLVTQLINKVLLDGKKSVAERTIYAAFDLVEAKTATDPLTVFKKAMDNVRPALEVKPKRVGGATYQVPIEVSSRRATTLAIRWIVGFARKRREKTMPSVWATRSWTPRTASVLPSRSVKTCSRWRSPTAPSRTTAGNRRILRPVKD